MQSWAPPGDATTIQRAIWTQLRLYADVAYDSNPLNPYIDQLHQLSQRADEDDEVRKMIRTLGRRLDAIETVERLEGVPWPVPEELERPGWVFGEASPLLTSVRIDHLMSDHGFASYAEIERVCSTPLPTDIETIRPWVGLHITVIGERKVEVRFGWSVRARTILVWPGREV